MGRLALPTRCHKTNRIVDKTHRIGYIQDMNTDSAPRSILDIPTPYTESLEAAPVIKRKRLQCVFCGGWMFQAIGLETRTACRQCRQLGYVEAQS
jgi:hypothetical protein